MTNVIDDISLSDLPVRIQKIYSACTEVEQGYLLKILEELSNTGESDTYKKVWLADYKEIPVDIDTFIESDIYLGGTNRSGQAVYPFWRKELRDFFNAGNQFHEWVLTGATRIGKTSTAVTAASYMLYRLMCLRDPQKFFNLKDISTISILFFNITKELASGVAYREFNDTLKGSPWFNAHGTFSKSERNFYYIPEGNKITIDFGSDASHGLGQQIFLGILDECVIGDTRIVTDTGSHRIEDLAGSSVNVLQYNPDSGTTSFVGADVVKTKETNETIKITLANGAVIEGTPEHPIMLSDGSYKRLGDITIYDDIACQDPEQRWDITGVDINILSIEHITHETAVPVYDVVAAEPYHNFIVESNGQKLVAHNCNFSRAGVKDVNKAKAHMRATYNIVTTRVKGTFKYNGEIFGKVFAVSSKRSDSDFMEAYVQEQQAAGAGDHMYITDASQWEVLPPERFKKERFYIALGDRYQKGFVVPDNQIFPEALEDLKNQGFKLLQPPVDMRSDFVADFEVALRDLAGIAVVGSMSFITQDSLNACIDTSRRNPFYTDTLQIGTKDSLSIEEFFHLSDISDKIKRAPHYLHLDLSLTTDRTGITDVCITDYKNVVDGAGKGLPQPYLSHTFSLALEAPRGDKIPYLKITAFICWLRKVGFNIKLISRDQYQSEYIAQLLEDQGFKVATTSLDRTPDGYMALRSIFLEERIALLNYKLLQDELVYLQRDAITGKVDHITGRSKDVSDSLAGAVWNAIQDNSGMPVSSRSMISAMPSINKPKGQNPIYKELPGLFPGLYMK